MFLQSLTLHNIRSYNEAKITFPEGSTLLAGDIGSGKSSILLAIEFALFGSSRPDLPAELLLRHGCTSGSVELTFLLQDKHITIQRELKKDKNGIKQSAGSLIINGVRKDLMPIELKTEIISLLGYPEEMANKNKNYIFRYTVYTPQEEMKLILQEDQDIRLDVLRKIFNVDKYKVIRENVQIYLRQLRIRMAVLSAKTESLEEEKRKQEEVNREREKKAKELQDIEPLVFKAREIMNGLQEKLEQAEKEQQQFVFWQQQQKEASCLLQEKEKQNRMATFQLQELQEKLQNLPREERPLEEIQPEILSLENEKKKAFSKKAEVWQQCQSIQQRLRELQQEIKTGQQELAHIPEKKRGLELLQQEVKQKKEFEEKRVLLQELVEKTSYLITKNRTILEQAREKEEKMGQLDVCPTCLQKVSAEHKHLILDEEGKKAAQAEHLLAEMESQKKQIMQQREETEKNFLEILHKENGITRIEFELEHLQKKQQEMEEKKEKLRSLVQENNVIMKEVERVEKEKVLEEMEEELRRRRELVQLLRERRIREQHRSEIEKQLQEYKNEETRLMEMKKEIEENVKKFTNQSQKIFQRKQEIRVAGENEKEMVLKKAEIKAAYEALCRQYKEFEERVILLAEEKKKREELKELSHWLEEYFLNVTQIIEKQVMVTIYRLFNELFKEWFSILIDDETVYARIDDSFSPIIEQNGYETPFTYLSGGEKTSCALAYRLALNRVINDIIQNIKTKDLLILDEPTDGFSEEQLDKVREVLEKLQLRQTIIVSHESKIESFVRQTIRLKKEGDVSLVRE
ncbi:SMC family ATPase [Candidatus Woesearchaeota archaeon]|nr:SMC family ATPase [Candidatus Woesearchaeota archaeon]